jgi:hypothetical protein
MGIKGWGNEGDEGGEVKQARYTTGSSMGIKG